MNQIVTGVMRSSMAKVDFYVVEFNSKQDIVGWSGGKVYPAVFSDYDGYYYIDDKFIDDFDCDDLPWL